MEPDGQAGPKRAGETPQRAGEMQVAIAILAAVTAIFVWWAWKQGAYFSSVFLPSSIVLYGLLILLLLTAPFDGRLNLAVKVALGALTALAAWTLLSILWTDSRDAALQDAEKAMIYAALFGLGLWAVRLAPRRPLLPFAAIAATGAVIGVVTVITLATGNDLSTYFHSDATLRFPVGYRNAAAAFLLICLWPTILLTSDGELPWWLRALLVGVATMLLDVAVLAESRGSLPATLIALLVLLLVAPRRLRVATYLAVAGLPVFLALPALLDVFQHGNAGPGLEPLMRDAARAIVLSTLASVALAAVFIRGLEMRVHLGRERVQLISRVAATIAIAIVAIGGIVFVAKQGGPVSFVDQRITEFERGGDPNFQTQGARFGVNVGSNRGDFWSVGFDLAGENPVVGAGAGSYAAAYLRLRDSPESPNDPHSVELLMLSELGVVGLLLFAAFLVAAVLAALASRRVGRQQAALVAGALTVAAYWLTHASYDWFWHYPAITGPVAFLLGAAAGPALAREAGAVSRRVRYPAAAALGLALLIAVPLFMSQRYANRAYDEYPGDPVAALRDLDRAADLDPYAPRPLLAKGLMELQLGRPGDAAESFREAVDRQPEGYAGHYFLARSLTRSDPESAQAEAAEALRLNPLDQQVAALSRRLQASETP